MSINIQDLILNTSKIERNFFAYETESSQIPTFEHNDLINDWHIEHIRRFNASTMYLINSLTRMITFGKLLEEGHNIITENGIPIDLVAEHRIACRDTCINIDICIEKIKAFCRHYFFMNPAKTDNTGRWVAALKEYNKIDGWDYIENFIVQCDIFNKNEHAKFIKDIRNAEIHNESPFELIHYHFEDASLQPIPESYVINNETLHNSIVETVSLLIKVISSLQVILENITPYSIYNYLKQQDNKSNKILEMNERYKYERYIFSKFEKR